MSTTLVTHCGATPCSQDDLRTIAVPPATQTWFPLSHSHVLATVQKAIGQAGFAIRGQKLAVARHGQRFFGTLDLTAPLGNGIALAVGIRNSIDKSLPIGFAAGSRVFVCDNLAFNSEVVIARKHTRFGADRFAEALCRAVASLHQFKEVEAQRIERLQQKALSDQEADSLLLQAFEQRLVAHAPLRQVIQEWRAPRFEDFAPRTAWSLLNAFTTILGASQGKSNPQQYARTTIAVQALLDGRPVDGTLLDEDAVPATAS